MHWNSVKLKSNEIEWNSIDFKGKEWISTSWKKFKWIKKNYISFKKSGESEGIQGNSIEANRFQAN